MKAYADIFSKPITKDDLRLAVQSIIVSGAASVMLLNRHTRLGIFKCTNILRLLQRAGVVSAATNGKRSVILKDEAQAVNAALRQLKKERR